jgi:hypothetical protein
MRVRVVTEDGESVIDETSCVSPQLLFMLREAPKPSILNQTISCTT